jgi:ABC-type multidrug transport system fused ATPase/permease subunit
VLVEPAILILDEATAGLDAETELLVKESLRKLPQHPTIVIVSHRLSTIVDADRVVLVQDGQLVAEGTHDELIRSSQAYRDLVENQLVRDGTSPA